MASPSYNSRSRLSGNPLFLPKSLFDSYIVKSHGGEITVDRIQTLASAERKVKELGKKYPCVGFDILSAKHGSVIKSYKASVGKGTPKVETDNSKRYKQEAVEWVKENMKYVLYLDGKEYASYDTKKEAEQAGRKEGGRVRVKAVVENPVSVFTSKSEARKFSLRKVGSKVVQGQGSAWLVIYPVRNPLTGSPSHDIPKLRKEGYPQKQATAIAVEAQRRKRSKRNPESAVDLYKDFHGVDHTHETVYEETRELPDSYAELGILIELWVIPTCSRSEKSVKLAAPNPDGAVDEVVRLAASPDAKQLHLIGGDQCIDVEALGFTDREIRENMFIGVITELTYQTKKKFDNLKTIQYFHKLGEESGNQPILTYDPHMEHMSIVGGNYLVKDVGIVD